MPSQVQISNMALANIGSKAQINDPEEQSNEAYFATLFWDDARRASLREHKWNFATKYQNLASLGTSVTDKWLFMYAYPATALAIRAILPHIPQTAPNEYEVALSSAGAKVILTDIAAAVACFTADITDTSLFDTQFVEAFSWKLSSLLAMPIIGDVRVKQSAETVYLNKLSSALVSDGSEGQQEEAPEAEWMRARL